MPMHKRQKTEGSKFDDLPDDVGSASLGIVTIVTLPSSIVKQSVG